MKHMSRLARVQHITDPATGRTFPIPAGGADDDPAPEPDPTPDPAPEHDPEPDPDPEPDDSKGDLPDWAQKELKRARDDAAKYRTQLRDVQSKQEQTDGVLQGIAKALGLEDGDEPEDGPDPESLQQAISQRDQTINAKTVELDAYKQAGKNGANPDALLDSASFLAKAAELDPSSDTYQADLASAIETAVENNPLLAASPGGGQGPAQGPRNTPPKQAGTLEEAFSAVYQ